VAKPVLGELVPVGGGDAIPLKRITLKVGRRESSDLCLRFPNISGTHCELSFKDGYWVIRDLNSTNGIKVNGERLRYRALRPGDRVTIGKRDYTINYDLHAGGQAALEAVLAESESVYNQSLMEKAGLTKSSRLDPFDMVERHRAADEDGDDDMPFLDDDD
jgi:pSer/pThr/pTyr-binding forkhead associated (FHA) protein